MEHYGAISLIPAAVVIVTALFTRRTLYNAPPCQDTNRKI